MLVEMKQNVVPLCDRHLQPMRLGRCFAANISMTWLVYKCLSPNCTRVYETSRGYYDIDDEVNVEDILVRSCPEDTLTMYLELVNDDGTQIWRCGQEGCNHSERVSPDERFAVMVIPVTDPSAENLTYA